ncbi:MAG: hypothetical protein ABSA58_25610, partial [Acetobacteraceae bacterium]
MRSLSRWLFGSASAALISAVVLMAIGIFSLLGMQFEASWHELAHANRVSLLAGIDRVVYQAAGAIRVGRGAAQVTLLAEDDPRADLAANFAAVDRQVQDMFRAIPSDLSDDTVTRLTELRAAWRKSTDLGEGVIAVAAKPRAERKLADTQAWFGALTVVVTGLGELSNRVAGAARISDPQAGEYIQTRQFAWAARLAVGDECGAVRSSFGSGTPLTPAQRTLVTDARGRAHQSMATLQELLSRPDAPAALRAAQTEATGAMQIGFKENDAAFENLGTAKQLDGASWEKQCVSLIEPVLKPGAIALDRMAAYATANRADAIRRLVISGIVMVTASLGIGVSLLLVRARIIR